MNFVDIAIIGFVLLSGIIGLMRGLTREVLGLFTWLGASVITYFTYPHVSYIAEGYFTNMTAAMWVTIVAVFIISVIILNIISQLISSIIQESALGGIDSSLGLGFGLLRGTLVLAAIEIFVSSFLPRQEHPKIVKNAFVSDFTYQASDILLSVLPTEIKQYISDFAKSKMKKQVEDSFDDVMNKAAQDEVDELSPNSSGSQANESDPLDRLRTKNDNKDDVESFARLKPKDEEESDKPVNYNKNQKQQLDRLMQTLQN